MREEIVRAEPREDEDDDGDTGQHSYRDKPEACTAVLAGLAVGISVGVVISWEFRFHHGQFWNYRRESSWTERPFAIIRLLLAGATLQHKREKSYTVQRTGLPGRGSVGCEIEDDGYTEMESSRTSRNARSLLDRAG